MPYDNSSSNATALQYFGWDRQPVSYNQIDQNMVNAIVAIEDSRYWVHGALDLRGTIRAAVNDIQHYRFRAAPPSPSIREERSAAIRGDGREHPGREGRVRGRRSAGTR